MADVKRVYTFGNKEAEGNGKCVSCSAARVRTSRR